MNKLIFTLNVFILLGVLPAQSMEDYELLTLQTRKYNDNDCPLANCKSKDKLIFACCQVQEINPTKSLKDSLKALEDTIKNFMKVRITCKEYYKYLTFEEIGNFCENHSCFAKNDTLGNLVQRFASISSWKSLEYGLSLRSPIYILMHANAYTKTNASLIKTNASLIKDALQYNDEYMLKTLFKYKILDPNERYTDGMPLFFSAKTIKMAQIFIDNGTNIHAVYGNPERNVFWCLLKQNPRSLNFVEFYFNRGVKIPAKYSDQIHKYIDELKNHRNFSHCLKTNEAAQQKEIAKTSETKKDPQTCIIS